MSWRKNGEPPPPLSFGLFPLASRLLVAPYTTRHGGNIFCAVAVGNEKEMIIVEHWCFLWVMGSLIHKQIRKELQREFAGKKSFLLGLSKAYEILSEFFRLTA